MPKYLSFWTEDQSNFVQPTVYYRMSWDDLSPWEALPNVRCVEASKGSGEAISRATLRFDYGDVMEPGEDNFSYKSPADILGLWVKVEWTPNGGAGNANYDFTVNTEVDLDFSVGQAEDGQRAYVFETNSVWEITGGVWGDTGEAPDHGTETWYGIATDEGLTDRTAGGLTGNDSGTQTITCYGPEWLLTRVQPTEFLTANGRPGSLVDRAIWQGTIPLNSNRGDTDNKTQGLGNMIAPESSMSPEGGLMSTNGFVYDRDMTDEADILEWNSYEAIKYFLSWFPAIEYDGGLDPDAGHVQFFLDEATEDLLSWIIPKGYEYYGKTLYEIVNDLIPRDRGLIWWVDTELRDDGGDTAWVFKVQVASLYDSDVNITSGIVPANDSQVTWDFISDPTVSGNAQVNSRQKRYSKIVVEGARRGAVCTLGYRSDNLVAAWDQINDEQAYNTAATLDPEYNNLDRKDQVALNDQKCSNDELLKKVFTTFKIDPNWDGYVNNGQGPTSESDAYVLPKLDENFFIESTPGGVIILENVNDPVTTEDGDPITTEAGGGSSEAQSPFIPGNVRYEKYLPMYKGMSYAADPSNPTDPSTGDPLTGEFRDPMCLTSHLIREEDDTFLRGDDMVPIELLTSSFDIETPASGAGAKSNGKLRLGSNGTDLEISSSAPPHYFAKDWPFNGASNFTFPTNVEPFWLYTTHLVTVYITFPERVRGSVTLNPVRETTANHSSTLLIQMGDKFHLDYLPQGTVVDLNGATPVEAVQGGYVRDDRPAMRNLLKMVADWYLKDRSSLSIKTQNLTSIPKIGDLVTDVVDSTATTETNSVVTMVSWNFQRQTTSSTTDFAELGGL